MIRFVRNMEGKAIVYVNFSFASIFYVTEVCGYVGTR